MKTLCNIGFDSTAILLQWVRAGYIQSIICFINNKKVFHRHCPVYNLHWYRLFSSWIKCLSLCRWDCPGLFCRFWATWCWDFTNLKLRKVWVIFSRERDNNLNSLHWSTLDGNNVGERQCILSLGLKNQLHWNTSHHQTGTITQIFYTETDPVFLWAVGEV